VKRMSVVGLAAFLCLVASAWAEEAQPAPPPPAGANAPAQGAVAEPAKPETSEPVALDDLLKGDRVSLAMKTGQQFEGHVVEVTPTTIKLDFTFSRQKMTGVVTFPREDAAGARRLPALTKEEKEAILDRRREGLLEAEEQWTAAVGTAPGAAAKPGAPAAGEKSAEERATEEKQMADYRALLAEFPPDQGWGPELLANIRYRNFIVGLGVSYQERRFWQLFDQWSEAKTKVELYDQRQKQEQEALLTLFPPEEGWDAAKKQQLEEKQKSGEQLTKLEARFLKDYDAWQKAVAARPAGKPAAAQAPPPVAPPAAPTPPAPSPATPPAATPAAPGPEGGAPESPAPPSPAPESPGTGEPAKP